MPTRTITIGTRVMWAIVLVASIALITCGAIVWALGHTSVSADATNRLEHSRDRIRELAADGTDPSSGQPLEDVSAVLGPSICGRCYEVPPSMRDEADALAPGAAATTSWGTPSVDIPRALVRQLASRGVEEVRLLGVCTFEDPAYFSHRRACAAGGKAGRFAGIAEATRDTPA